MGIPLGLHQYLTPQGDGNGRVNAGINIGNLGDATFDFEGGTVPDVWTLAANKLEVDDKVRFTAAATGALEYLVNTDYYVATVHGTDEFTLAATLGGDPIEGTSNSGGTWTLTREATTFYIQPGLTEKYIITALVIFIEDATGWDAAEYGSGVALTNGVTVRKQTGAGAGTTVEDITAGQPILHNGEWTVIARERDRTAFGSGDEAMTLTIEFLNGGLPLSGANLDRLEVIIDDDLSGLTEHKFFAHGYYPDVGA